MEDGAEEFAVEVGADAAGERLDRVLAGILPRFSRSRLQALIRSGHVTAGGRTIVEAKYRVNSGERLTVAVPPPVPAEPRPQAIPLHVVYEDEAIVVVDKPAGLVVHPGAGTPDGTLVNALLHHCAGRLPSVGGVERPGIVHRLDKDTSGLMVVARTDEAHRDLSAQFADHGRTGVLDRRYLALAWGVPSRAEGTVDAPIGRSRANPEKMAVRPGGRHAVTRWRLLEAFGEAASLLECTLETGRTHQVRVHLAHAGMPLLGDAVYGAGFATKAARLAPPAREALAALGRQALHAYVLTIRHPATGQTMTWRSPPPEDYAALIERLRGT